VKVRKAKTLLAYVRLLLIAFTLFSPRCAVSPGRPNGKGSQGPKGSTSCLMTSSATPKQALGNPQDQPLAVWNRPPL